jgi:phenylacetate-CoA ligase
MLMPRLRILNFFEMLRNQRKSLPELENLQSRRLRRLVRHASASVPFYGKRFRAIGLEAEDIRSLADLKHIPITTKEQLQSAGVDEITSRTIDLSRCVAVSTSGSTGIPLRLLFTREDYSRLNMNWLRPLLAHGVKPWQRKFEITGPHNISLRKSWYNYLGLWNQKTVSIFDPAEKWAEDWRTFRPDILSGYSLSLKLFAGYVLAQEIQDIVPEFVFGVSELADDSCRALIEQAFRKRLADIYGAAETGCIAWECPECRGYHINLDTVIVEFLENGEPAPPGTVGKIIVTNLCSQAMPILRYELGDVGVRGLQKPSCGRGLSLMEIVEGRSDAFLVLPSGRVLSPLIFFAIMKPLPGIRHWKVYQPDTRRLTILVVPGQEFSGQAREQIRSRVTEIISEPIELEIKIVETIPSESSGKIRSVVSEVKSAF